MQTSETHVTSSQQPGRRRSVRRGLLGAVALAAAWGWSSGAAWAQPAAPVKGGAANLAMVGEPQGLDPMISTADLVAKGAPLLDKTPRPGAGGARVAFVHPKGSRGVLVELRQGKAHG